MIVSFICHLSLSVRSFGIGSRSLLEEIAASDAIGELPVPKKLLTVLAVALAVPQFSKRLLADVAYVVVKARIYAPGRRDIHRGPRGDARVSRRLKPIGVVLKN